MTETIPMPFASFCKNTKCQMLILKGTPVVKVAPGEYVHDVCRPARFRHFAAHKQPDTGMEFSDIDERQL